MRVSAPLPPAEGSGPGLLLLADESMAEARLAAFAARFAEEGYVVVTAQGHGSAAQGPGLAAAGLAACRGHGAHRGMTAAVTFGSAAGAGLAGLAEGGLACAILHDPHGDASRTPGVAAFASGLLLHLAAEAADGALAGTVRESAHGEVYGYADGSERGWLPGEAGAPPLAGIAFSRTLGALRRAIGPRYDLSALWERHRDCEFVTRDADATMRTMVAEPYVNHVPTMIGGHGARALRHFYAEHFIPNNPKDMRSIPVSRTVGADRVVNETILCFTHDREIAWMLPGVAPTHRYVEVALIGIITFRGGKLAHEHIYWDQASVLVQIGLLDPDKLPVVGIQSARKVLEPTLPSSGLPESARPG